MRASRIATVGAAFALSLAPARPPVLAERALAAIPVPPMRALPAAPLGFEQQHALRAALAISFAHGLEAPSPVPPAAAAATSARFDLDVASLSVPTPIALPETRPAWLAAAGGALLGLRACRRKPR